MAIVYSYPKVTSPLATDVLVLTDTTVTAGKRKNKTKSIAMSDVATYVINTKSGITGSGTVNKFPIFTASTVVGDSIITQAALGQGITVGGNLDVTNDTNLQGSLLADSLEVTNDSVFIGSARFNGTIKDTSGGVGTNGQVLTSTGTGVAWTTDAGGSVTGTGTTNYIAKWNTSSSIQDSIIFDNGTNVGIGTNTPNFLLDVEAQGANIRVFNLTSDANTDVYIRTTGTAGSSKILFGDSADPDVGNIIYRHNSNSLAFGTDNSEKMRILANGNVGIGTTSPTEKLDIYSDSNAVIRLESAGGGVGMLDVGTDFTINNRINTNLIFKTSNAERMRITNNGSVGINTSSPNERLSLKNNGDIGISLENTADISGNYWKLWQDNWNGSSNFTFNINYGGTDFLTATTDGKIGIGITNPGSPLTVKSNSVSSQSSGISIQANGSTDDIIRLAEKSDNGGRFHMFKNGVEKIAFHTDGTSSHISEGNVGIGTASPGYKFQVNGGNVAITGGSSSTLFINQNTNQLYGDENGVVMLKANDNIRLHTNSSEIIRINSLGNVGIGTTSPQAKLHVNGSEFLVTQGNETGLDINNDTYIYKIGDISGGENQAYMQIDSAASKAFFLNSNIGIGTTSPTAKLDVNGEIAIRGGEDADDPRMYFRASDQSNRFTIETDFDGSTSNDILGFRSVNTDNILTLKGNGNVGIGTTSPASKLTVTGGDAEVTGSDKGLILESPNGTRYRIQVDNSGNLTTTAV